MCSQSSRRRRRREREYINPGLVVDCFAKAIQHTMRRPLYPLPPHPSLLYLLKQHLLLRLQKKLIQPPTRGSGITRLTTPFRNIFTLVLLCANGCLCVCVWVSVCVHLLRLLIYAKACKTFTFTVTMQEVAGQLGKEGSGRATG